MGIVETAQANATVADFDRFRLRRFVEAWLPTSSRP